MKIITIISPDKLSMSMFYDFYRAIYVGEDTLNILDLNCIFSQEAVDVRMSEFVKSSENYSHGIIKYKTKVKTVLTIPQKILEYSDYIVKFDIYSNHPDLIKDSGGGVAVIDRWNKNIIKLDGGAGNKTPL